jgi:hypothetical protein
LKYARFVIGDGVLLTVGFDDVLRFFQSVPGHGREQMMLDLVVQPTIPEVGQGVSFDIARSKHLLT